jgi:hypothetical protein
MSFVVHQSHSRKELFDIIAQFKLPIKGKHDKNKKQLSQAIVEVIDYLDVIEPEQEYFFVDGKDQLIEYLKSQNPAKSLTIKEKDEVMAIAKKIIAYGRSNYYLVPCGYMDTLEIYRDARYISKFPEIPSVRRAIEIYNKDPKCREKIEIVLPRRVKKQLEKKKKIKQMTQIPLYIKHAPKNKPFIISFD